MHFKYLEILFIVFLVTGCGSATKYYEKHIPVDILNSEQKEVTVRVLAEADAWLNSGAIVKAGQQYRISATGKWHGGLICGWTGPDGIGASQVCLCSIIPGWSISTLIARINDDGLPFAVGNDYTFVAAHDGILQFHINDPPSSSSSLTSAYCWPYTRDNQGYVTAKISVPEIKQDIIDVKIIGYDNGIKTTKQKDYREALLNAKRQAIERAGVEVESKTRVKDFRLEEDYIETHAKAILMPGFEVIDIGYTEGRTYHVMLIGKIKVSGFSNR
jgi:hypothetical protein